jgi:hypothetical protein
VSPPAPLDPRRKAFADALGHLVAELVWREVVGAKEEPNTAGVIPPENEIAPPALVGVDPTGREVNDGKCNTISHP